MPLETGTFLPDLNASNPAHTDGINSGDAHIRLIKAILKNTFPNFTEAAVNSTQAAIDGAVGTVTSALSGAFAVAVDGSLSNPAYTWATEGSMGFYRKAAHTTGYAIQGAEVFELSPAGVDVVHPANLLASGVAIFPLQSANIGASQVLTAAIAPHNVTYGLGGSLQNSAAANVLLGSTSIGGFYGEITLGSGLSIVGGALTSNVTQPLPSVLNLAIDNDGTTPNTKLNVSADACVLVDGSGNTQRFFNVAVTLDFTTTGAGGCDVGTRAASKGYYIYLIGNGTTVAPLASLDTNATPTFPVGYTATKRVGWYRTDGSSNLVKIRTRGGDAVNLVTLPSVASGASAGASAAVAGLLSPNATKVSLSVTSVGANIVQVSPTSAYSPSLFLSGTGTSVFEMMLEGASFWYISAGASNNALLRGWSFPQ